MPFLKTDRQPTILHPKDHPVSVIAAFSVLGDLIPRYFCIEDDYQELFKYKVSAVCSIKDSYMIRSFYCTYDAYGYRNNIILIFDFTTCKWMVG